MRLMQFITPGGTRGVAVTLADEPPRALQGAHTVRELALQAQTSWWKRMRLMQFITPGGTRGVAVTLADEPPRALQGAHTVRELALQAHRRGCRLRDVVVEIGLGPPFDASAAEQEGRLLPPLDHPDPAHCTIGITGLTHLGSAASRDAMHAKLAAADLSDSMKMFKLGVEGGKPAPGHIGVEPEWAYKGDGDWMVRPGAPITIPSYAEDGGEEAEIVGLYVIGDAGDVLRVGYAIGNEHSDHVLERRNYLYLAHSKLRQCAFGPELLVGALPPSLSGTVSLSRNGEPIWSTEFLLGEDNMCHAIANLEHHHFKYAGFRRPGDVHVYFFGASVLSFADGVRAAAGDVVEIAVPEFGRALRNPLAAGADRGPIPVHALE